MRTLLVSALFLLTVLPVQADVLVVPVEKTIDGGLSAFIDRALGEAESSGAGAVIFHIDTPGGRVDSAVRIKDAILRSPVTTAAFVDKNAISAGALISLACDSLYMAEGGSIGAATAVDLQGNKASEKVISYFRAQMRATAEATGRPPRIAEAMVDEQIAVDGVTISGQLLTLTYTEAASLGISDGTRSSPGEVAASLGMPDDPLRTLHPNWAENVVRFFTHPVVSSLLMSIGFLGLIIEIRTPGWGVGGTIALIALALFFGSHYIVRLADMGELLMFAVGIILLTVEVLIIPGFGIAGIGGIALVILSLYLSMLGSFPRTGDVHAAGVTVAAAFAVALTGGILLFRYLPSTPVFRRFILDAEEQALSGYTSSNNSTNMVGMTGTALSDLRPSGKALIAGKRIDVVTDGDYIDKDAPVTVVEARGMRIVVTRASEDI